MPIIGQICRDEHADICLNYFRSVIGENSSKTTSTVLFNDYFHSHSWASISRKLCQPRYKPA